MATRNASRRLGGKQRRWRSRFETLEPRNLLAAGLIPIDLNVPLNRTVQGFTVVGTANVAADVVVVDPAQPADTVISDPTASGTGTLSGTFLGATVEGTFTVYDTPPVYEFDFIPPDTLKLKASVGGTLDLLVDGSQQVPGTFTATLEGAFNATTGTFNGTLKLLATADGFQQQIDVPVTVPNALPGLTIPDKALPSIADQAFVDANNNGIRDAGETGIGGVGISLIDDASDNVLESTTTNVDGFYSFYNLPVGDYLIAVNALPDGFDLGKNDVGFNDFVDSDINSRSGQSESVSLAAAQHVRNLDIALRQTQFEWQNPNKIEDVTGEGDVTSLDALRIINFLTRNEGPVELAADRPIGADFYDVTGEGNASALDALRVINALARIANQQLETESVLVNAVIAPDERELKLRFKVTEPDAHETSLF